MFVTLLGLRLWIGCSRDLVWICRYVGLRCPAAICTMYLAGEHEDYLAAAIMACNQTGE